MSNVLCRLNNCRTEGAAVTTQHEDSSKTIKVVLQTGEMEYCITDGVDEMSFMYYPVLPRDYGYFFQPPSYLSLTIHPNSIQDSKHQAWITSRDLQQETRYDDTTFSPEYKNIKFNNCPIKFDISDFENYPE